MKALYVFRWVSNNIKQIKAYVDTICIYAIIIPAVIWNYAPIRQSLLLVIQLMH